MAQWGMKDELIGDVNTMLCHNCGDCNAYCPRGAKPGEVLGAIRAYAYTHFGFPQGLAKLASDGKNLPILIGIPAAVVLVLWLISGGMHMPDGPVDFGMFFGHWDFHWLTKTTFFIDIIFLPVAAFALFAAQTANATATASSASGAVPVPRSSGAKDTGAASVAARTVIPNAELRHILQNTGERMSPEHVDLVLAGSTGSTGNGEVDYALLARVLLA